MKRREFWKFFAAAPVAAVASVAGAGAKLKPEIPMEGITIEGNNVMLSNLHLENTGITIKSGAQGACITGCYITGAPKAGIKVEY